MSSHPLLPFQWLIMGLYRDNGSIPLWLLFTIVYSSKDPSLLPLPNAAMTLIHVAKTAESRPLVLLLRLACCWHTNRLTWPPLFSLLPLPSQRACSGGGFKTSASASQDLQALPHVLFPVLSREPWLSSTFPSSWCYELPHFFQNPSVNPHVPTYPLVPWLTLPS